MCLISGKVDMGQGIISFIHIVYVCVINLRVQYLCRYILTILRVFLFLLFLFLSPSNPIVYKEVRVSFSNGEKSRRIVKKSEVLLGDLRFSASFL